jgi:hypothetical protein
MSTAGEKFSRKQEQAIAALLAEPTIEKAARAAGIGFATLRRWLQNDDFQERYRQAKKQTLDAVMSHLQLIAGEAVETLREVAVNREAPASSRVAASRAILETAMKVVEAEEIERRLIELERRLLK